MIYRESKVYFDGSHYIAIPHTNRPPSNRRKPVEEFIEVRIRPRRSERSTNGNRRARLFGR